METRLQTEKVRMDSQVSGVGYVMQLQQAMLKEVPSGIHVLQEQHNQIVGEATDLFVGRQAESNAQPKNIINNGLRIVVVKTSVQAAQKTVAILLNTMYEVNKVLATITESMKHIPSNRELHHHSATMDEKWAQVEEIYTRLTTAIEQYKFSESTPFEFGQSVAGPSGTHRYTHPEWQPACQSPSGSRLRDTESVSTWNFRRIQGGAGSD